MCNDQKSLIQTSLDFFHGLLSDSIAKKEQLQRQQQAYAIAQQYNQIAIQIQNDLFYVLKQESQISPCISPVRNQLDVLFCGIETTQDKTPLFCYALSKANSENLNSTVCEIIRNKINLAIKMTEMMCNRQLQTMDEYQQEIFIQSHIALYNGLRTFLVDDKGNDIVIKIKCNWKSW